MTHKNTVFFLIFLLLSLGAACNSEQAGDIKREVEEAELSGSIAVPKGTTVSVYAVDTAAFGYSEEYPAEVESSPDSEYIVTSPIDGRIHSCAAHEGEAVRAGETVIFLESLEFNSMLKDFVVAHNEVQTKELALERAQKLSEREISPAKNYEQAAMEFLNAQARAAVAQARLQTVGLTPDEIEGCKKGNIPTYLPLRVGINGMVQNHDVVPGQYVRAGDAIMSVLNSDKVLVKIYLPLEKAHLVRPGDKVSFYYRQQSIEGLPPLTVGSIAPGLDSHSRSRPAFVHIRHNKGIITPGSRLQSHIEIRQQGGFVSIPDAALELDGDKAAVYVKDQNDIFSHRHIVLGERKGNRYLVQEGIEKGEEVAISHLFLLKSLRRAALLDED